MEATGELTASGGDDGVGTSQTPKHAGVFKALTDDGSASGFNNAGTDEVTHASELCVSHGGGIVMEVAKALAAVLGGGRNFSRAA